MLIYISIIIELMKRYLLKTILFIDPFESHVSLNYLIIGFLVNLFLAYNISLRQPWSRIILLIVYLIDIILFFRHISLEFMEHWSIGFLATLKGILQATVLIILFSGESNKWFSFKNNRGRIDL